jgi:hypothetical protein
MGLVVTQRQTASFQLAFFSYPIPKRQGYLRDYSFVPFFWLFALEWYSFKKIFSIEKKKKINSTIGFAGWVLYSSAGYWKTMGSRVCVWSHRESSAFWGAGAWNDQLYKTSRERRAKSTTTPKKKNQNDVCCTFPWKHQHVRISDIVIITERFLFFWYIFCSYLIFSFFLVAV